MLFDMFEALVFGNAESYLRETPYTKGSQRPIDYLSADKRDDIAEEEMVGIIHDIFHALADKHGLDVDTIADIISDYDEMMDEKFDRMLVVYEN